MPEESHDPTQFPAPWNYLIPLGRKLLIWVLFFSCLYLLRHFMPLVFLTFVFAYIAEHGVQGLAHRMKSRGLRTCIVFVTMIAVLGLLAAFLGPELKRQAVSFVQKIPSHLESIDKSVEKEKQSRPWLADFLGERHAKEIIVEVIGLPAGSLNSKQKPAEQSGSGSKDKTAPQAATSPSPSATGPPDEHEIKTVFGLLFSIFKNIAAVSTMFFLALLFAFLIILDLPKISKGVQSLEGTKIRVLYDELSSTVLHFGQVLGRFLEAQLVIAIINTALTSIGLVILGIHSVAFLAGVVFVCSFIPVAGVFLSTAPMSLVGLESSGFSMVLWIVVMICIVHAIEAYVLNPMIFGAHLHLNPVLVLSVLVIGHELFGIWGLLLGVPTVTYVISYAIKEREAQLVAAGGSPPDDEIRKPRRLKKRGPK